MLIFVLHTSTVIAFIILQIIDVIYSTIRTNFSLFSESEAPSQLHMGPHPSHCQAAIAAAPQGGESSQTA